MRNMPFTMPKVPTCHWSYHRHFSPLICQSIFSPERGVTPPPLTQHRTFPRNDRPVESERNPLPTETVQTKTKILKPRGEVSRINRGGYNLQEKLGWPATDYEEVRVSNSPSPLIVHYMMSGQTFVIQLAREHLSIAKPWSKQKQESLKAVFVEVS